jgi:hypothetical protein
MLLRISVEFELEAVLSCCQLRTHRCVDASNIEPLLWTATALGVERLTAGCAQYLLSRDVIATAPAQVLRSCSGCPGLCTALHGAIMLTVSGALYSPGQVQVRPIYLLRHII